MPRVFNKRYLGNSTPINTVYIGRPSKWGNPFVIGPDGTRLEVVHKYLEYVLATPSLMSSLHELRGKDLICWCAPAACQGDILMNLSNGGQDDSDSAASGGRAE